MLSAGVCDLYVRRRRSITFFFFLRFSFYFCNVFTQLMEQKQQYRLLMSSQENLYRCVGHLLRLMKKQFVSVSVLKKSISVRRDAAKGGPSVDLLSLFRGKTEGIKDFKPKVSIVRVKETKDLHCGLIARPWRGPVNHR